MNPFKKPVNGAERTRNYRKRITAKADLCAAYKEKDRERKRASRKKVVSPLEAEKERIKCRERVRLHRLKKKGAATGNPTPTHDPNDIIFAYKSPQALGKAVHKVTSHLPHSPRKRKAVISKLAKSSGLSLPDKTKQSPNGNKKIDESTVQSVQKFYFQDSISRQAPGRRDFVIVREDGKKSKLQKRHLTWSLKETFGLFVKENPDVKISLSKFSTLRPVNVLLQSSMPREVCLCMYHDNVKILCDSLSKEMSSFPPYSGSFVDHLVCDSSTEECMMGKCANCPNWLADVKKDAPLDDLIKWSQWERVTHTIATKQGKPKLVKKMEKVMKEGTVEEALNCLEGQIPSFLVHVFIKRKQSTFFEERIAQLKADEAIVQVDFAENYTCQYQDEIQAAHWSQEQITLFTVAIWVKDAANTTTCNSHVIVSDDHSHEKKSIAVFMDLVVNTFVKERYPQVKVVDIFSDGPNSQFKNRYMANFYSILQRQGIKIKWHFFATSHGKGVVDGLGGTVKRVVWTAVSTRKVPQVLNAEAFAKVAMEMCKSISIKLYLNVDIDKSSSKLGLDECFKQAKPIPGIKKIHCLDPTNGDHLHCRLYSSQISTHKEIDLSSDNSDLSSEMSVSETEGDDAVNVDDNVDTSNDEDEENVDDNDEDEENVDDNDDGNVDNNSDGDSDGDDDIQIELGLPNHIKECLNKQCANFELHPCSSFLVRLVVGEGVDFEGDSLIDLNDLKELEGNLPQDESKWLSNFVIDSYLQMIKSESTGVEVFRWEVFEKGVGKRKVEQLLQGKGNLLQQDAVFFPCNSPHSKHWFLGVVLPKEKSIVVLDSLPGLFVKPTASRQVKKMMTFLQKTDMSTNINQWSFYANKPGEIPQQVNAFDCGVFTCLFARCLATRCVMITQPHIPAYRKLMIQELHQKKLSPLPPMPIQQGEYYAVDYVKNFYIGRVLDVTDQDCVQFKFLYKVGATTFHWPRRDDVDQAHISNIFYGPVTVPSFISGPFTIPEQSDVEELFNLIRKFKRFSKY